MGVIAALDKKTISITGRRQITIPQKLYESLGLGKGAECVLRNGGLVICPVRDSEGEMLSEQSLVDLISQGYSGDELLEAFRQAKAQIRPAVEAMLEEAGMAAVNPERYASYDDVFGAEDSE